MASRYCLLSRNAFAEIKMDPDNRIEKTKGIKRTCGIAARGIFAAVLLCLFSFVISSGFAFAAPPNQEEGTPAEENAGVVGGAFEVTGYDLTASVSKDHSYEVEERISVNIPDQLSSIEFAIPSGNFRISDIEVENTAYAAKRASEASTVSIVDSEKLSEGRHEYTIKYRIREFRDRDSTKDMFYFNVLLPEWRQPIGAVNIKVSFPEDFPWEDMQCYAGQFGVQDVTNKIDFNADGSSKTVSITGKMIPENFGITLKAQLPDGYWEDALDGSWAVYAIIGVMAGAALILLILWYIGGRDPKVEKEVVTRPVEGISPVELGYAFNSEVRISDILHMVVQFAEKGYLRISEYEPKRYRLVKGKEPEHEEKMYRNAYSILFEDVYTNRALDMEDIGERLIRMRAGIEDDVAAGFASGSSSAFTPLSRGFRYAGAVVMGISLGLADAFSYLYEYRQPNYAESIVICAVTAFAALLLCREIDTRDSSSVSEGRLAEIASGILLAIPVLYTAFNVFRNTGSIFAALIIPPAAVLAAFLIVIMRARGEENAKLVGKVRSLRNFIYHPTPKELLENYLADSNYYYDMLIYALAFGGEEAWAISFLTLDVPEPGWYSDDIEGHAFSKLRGKATTIDYARDLRSFIRTFENIQ